ALSALDVSTSCLGISCLTPHFLHSHKSRRAGATRRANDDADNKTQSAHAASRTLDPSFLPWKTLFLSQTSHSFYPHAILATHTNTNTQSKYHRCVWNKKLYEGTFSILQTRLRTP